MIRCVLHTDEGPVIFIGIVEENIRRLHAKHPMEVDLGTMLVESTKRSDLETEAARGAQRIRLYVCWGETHAEILSDIERGTKIALPAVNHEAAAKLDAQLRREGLA